MAGMGELNHMNDRSILNRPTALEAILRETADLGFSMASESQTGSLLRTLAASKPAGRFLELGTGTGVGIVARLATLLDVPSDAICLDVACGTGNCTTAMAASRGRWHGVEISLRMLSEAHTSRVQWVLGDALALPFAAGSFTRVMCTLAIHHFANLGRAFAEIARVLRRGRLVLFTSAPSQMRQYWLNEYFPLAMARSIAVMPELDLVQTLLVTAGFASTRVEPWDVPPNVQDLFLYSGKHQPEMYLSASVRRGISTFEQHADSAEIDAGCTRLRTDIENGRIDDVRRAYISTRGDYASIVTERKE
jgi:SAM-dependent methyltransferase